MTILLSGSQYIDLLNTDKVWPISYETMKKDLENSTFQGYKILLKQNNRIYDLLLFNILEGMRVKLSEYPNIKIDFDLTEKEGKIENLLDEIFNYPKPWSELNPQKDDLTK
jgi:hypothetical protein